MTITNTAIRILRTEAAMALDWDMVEVCERALAGDVDARVECYRAIRDAAAMAD